MWLRSSSFPFFLSSLSQSRGFDIFKLCISLAYRKEVTVDVREDGEDIEDRRSRSGRKPQRVAVAPLPVLLLNFDGLSSVHSETKDSI
jgi:hypothetical protein